MALRGGVATGIHFHPITSDALAAALLRLLELYNDPLAWSRLQRNAMRQPVGWDGSAAEYAALYEAVTANG
jgi:starch synthase